MINTGNSFHFFFLYDIVYKKINEYTNNKIKLIKSDKNGGYAYGNVSSSNTTWYPSAHPDGIHGLVDVRLSMGRREPGDSGGPIYTADGLFLGTHTGAGDEDGYGFSHIVFSPYVYLSNSGFSALTS